MQNNSYKMNDNNLKNESIVVINIGNLCTTHTTYPLSNIFCAQLLKKYTLLFAQRTMIIVAFLFQSAQKVK
jgi:hypothetical protein